MLVSEKPVAAKSAHDLIAEKIAGKWRPSECCVGTTSQDNLRTTIEDHHCVPFGAPVYECQCTSAEEAEKARRFFIDEGYECGRQDEVDNADMVYVFFMDRGTQP